MSKDREIRQLRKDMKTARAEIAALQKKLTEYLLKRKNGKPGLPPKFNRESS
jgi:hypothetical protein